MTAFLWLEEKKDYVQRLYLILCGCITKQAIINLLRLF